VTIDQLRGDELAGLRVLVVDDEPETLELVSLTLRSAGAEVFEASGAEVALEQLGARAPDVVLSDLQMPGLDGFELMRRLKDRPASPVAVALSANASLDDARRALEAGFSVHVAKPIGTTDLVETVRAVAPPGSVRIPQR
jgi:CheY-like chemotaxis protein